MTHPIRQEPFVWGNNPPVPNPHPQNTQTPIASRRHTCISFSGVAIIICGVIEICLGVAVLCISLGNYRYLIYIEYVGCGIWSGVFSVIAGGFGVYAQRSNCKMITFMAMAIIVAFLSGVCILITGFSCANAVGNLDGNHLAMYFIICMTFAVQFIVSIFGASATCAPLCSPAGTDQVVVYYAPYPCSEEGEQVVYPPINNHQSPFVGYSDEPPLYPQVTDGEEAKK